VITIDDVKGCPFCGAKAVEHPNPVTRREFFIMYHEPGCYFLTNNSSNYTLLQINRHIIENWNKRI